MENEGDEWVVSEGLINGWRSNGSWGGCVECVELAGGVGGGVLVGLMRSGKVVRLVGGVGCWCRMGKVVR